MIYTLCTEFHLVIFGMLCIFSLFEKSTREKPYKIEFNSYDGAKQECIRYMRYSWSLESTSFSLTN